MSRQKLLLNMYGALLDSLGPSNWWPGQDSPFEVCLGALLTQNTNWANVEMAIWNLRDRNFLHPQKLYELNTEDLAELIRPAGYFRVKAARLKNFLFFLKHESGFDLELLAQQDMNVLRSKLLSVKGIGPETADSMLLYAFRRPSFVVDAYTLRILNRHMMVHQDIDYHELRSYFMDVLPENVYLYNEFHALLVRAGKKWCKKKTPLCGDCPLFPFL